MGVAGGSGRGPGLGNLDGPCGVCVATDGSLLISERGPEVRDYRVSRWVSGAAEGSLLAGGRGSGGAAEQLCMPWDIAETPDGGFVIVDSGNHRVVHWGAGQSCGVVVAGGNGRGVGLHQLKNPCCVAIAPL